MKIHHLGVVTLDVPGTLEAFGLCEADIVEVVEDHNQMNRLYFIPLEENRLCLELVEPMDETSSVYRFAKKNTVGLHHIAFDGEDLPQMKAAFAQRPGYFPLGEYSIAVKTFGGKIRTLFVAFKGLIVEYVERLEK